MRCGRAAGMAAIAGLATVAIYTAEVLRAVQCITIDQGAPSQVPDLGFDTRWELWPYPRTRHGLQAFQKTRVGIVTGGSSDLFGGGDGSYGDVTACLFRLYALAQGYAFFVERAMQRFGNDRPVAWHKLRLLLDRLSDVDLLLWVDADIAWTNHTARIEEVLLQHLSSPKACRNLGQGRWSDLSEVDSNEIFLWASADVRPKQELNLNSAVLAFRNGPTSRYFLTTAIEEGKDPLGFTRHDPKWQARAPGNHYWGWPFEQGAFWNILTGNRDLLERTCVVEVGLLHSVQYKRWYTLKV